jgi:hypothetical protein
MAAIRARKVQLLETVFSVRSVPKLYKEEKLRLPDSLDATVRRVAV